jgi:hypothetical protein
VGVSTLRRIARTMNRHDRKRNSGAGFCTTFAFAPAAGGHNRTSRAAGQMPKTLILS